MDTPWPLQDAKNKFSELVDKALTAGPQHITRRGKRAVVVLSEEEYARLTAGKGSLMALLQRCPVDDLVFERNQDPPRPVDL